MAFNGFGFGDGGGLTTEQVETIVQEYLEENPPPAAGAPVYLPTMDLSVTQSDSGLPTTLALTASTYVDGVLEADVVLPTVTIGGDDYGYFCAVSEAIFTGSGTCEINFNLPVAGEQVIAFGLLDSSVTPVQVVVSGGGQGSFLYFQTDGSGVLEAAFISDGVPTTIDLPVPQSLQATNVDNTLTSDGAYNVAVSTTLAVVPGTEHTFTNNQDDVGHDPQVIYFGYANVGFEMAGSLAYVLSNPTEAGYYATKLVCIGTDGSTFNLDSIIAVEAVVDTLTNLSAPAVELGTVRFKFTVDGVDPDIKHLQYASGVDSLTDLLQITAPDGMKPFIYAKHDTELSLPANALDFNLNLPTVKPCTLTYDFDTLEASLVIDGGDSQALGAIPSLEILDGATLKVFAVELVVAEEVEPQPLTIEFVDFTQVELSTNDLPEDAKDGDLLPVSVGGERFGEVYEAGDLLELADNLTKGILLVKRTLKRKVLSEDIEFTTGIDGQPEHKIFKFVVEAGKTYKIKAGLLWSSSANTNGISFGVATASGTPHTGTFAANASAPTSQGTGTDTTTIMAVDHNHYLFNSNTSPQANDVYLASCDAVYVCTASSNICLLVGSEFSSGGTTTLKAGTYMEVEEI